jgi:hypothetical protein
VYDLPKIIFLFLFFFHLSSPFSILFLLPHKPMKPNFFLNFITLIFILALGLQQCNAGQQLVSCHSFAFQSLYRNEFVHAPLDAAHRTWPMDKLWPVWPWIHAYRQGMPKFANKNIYKPFV